MTRIGMASSCNNLAFGTSVSGAFLCDCKVKDFIFKVDKFYEPQWFYRISKEMNSQKT
jgi:hypothetical protein